MQQQMSELMLTTCLPASTANVSAESVPARPESEEGNPEDRFEIQERTRNERRESLLEHRAAKGAADILCWQLALIERGSAAIFWGLNMPHPYHELIQHTVPTLVDVGFGEKE